ncbi:MAG: hypothetical protein H6982_07460 [Chromatiales bacterium]|nr:hypothetical protein [Chromatiales bacterium]
MTATDDDTDTLDAAPDYTIDITDDVDTLEAGDTPTFRVNVENTGTQDGTGVVVVARFDPTLLTNVVASDGGIVDLVAGTITWNLGDLDVGATRELTFTGTVADVIPDGVELVETTATITDDGAGTGGTPVTATDDDTDTLDAAPDYTIDITDDVDTLEAGDTPTFRVNVENTGTQDGTGVVVVARFDPTLLTNVVASDGGIVDLVAGTITWNLGDLDVGATRELTFTGTVADVIPDGVELVETTATITDDGAGTGGTPVTATDDDTDALDAAPDYTIDITDDVDTLEAGDTPTFRVNVENTGTQDGTGVVVVARFDPTLLTNVVASDGGIVDLVAGTITWNLGDLDVGATRELTFTGTVADVIPDGVELVETTATITDDGAGTGGTPVTATATDTDNLGATPDYQVTITDDLDTARPGDTVTVRVGVGNVGEQDGTGVVVVARFDPSIMADIVPTDGGIVDRVAGTVTWNLGDLDAGTTRELSFTSTLVRVPPPGVSSYQTIATVTDDGANGPDPTPADNRAEDSTELSVFVFDAIRNAAFDGGDGDDEALRAYLQQREWARPPLPVAPLYSGAAEPGTVLSITLLDHTGAPIGTQTVVTDAGGNWMASFASVVVSDHPHAVTVEQITSPVNGSTESAFNLRTYFSPAVHSQFFVSEHPGVAEVLGRMPSATMAALESSLESPLPLGWSEAYAYEFLAASTSPQAFAR